MKFEFIESPIFSAYVYDYLTDEEYGALQEFLCEQPEFGDVVPGSGGVRKLRWARKGRGKSGGARVCYYFRDRAGQIVLLTIYAKNVRATLPGHILKALKQELEHEDGS
jgi:mRNA-degrading endonuclease RelE of RelBE toxin-antitoxin system